MLLPKHVNLLLQKGHKVTVERWENRCVVDSEYESIKGVTMAENGTWVRAPKDAVILGLKELPESPPLLSRQHVYFAHCYKRQGGWERTLRRFMKGEGKLWDLEYLRDEGGKRALAFGVVAGFAGMALGLIAWAREKRGVKPTWEAKGLPTETFKDVVSLVRKELGTGKLPVVCVVASSGRCGRGAVDCARRSGLPEKNIVEWGRGEIGTGGPFEILLGYDILCNCIYLTKEIKTPFLVSKMLHAAGRHLSVVVDVSCDSESDNNPLPLYAGSTSFDKPVQRVFPEGEDSSGLPLDVVAIDHLPSLVALEASGMFGDKMVELLMRFGDVKGTVQWRVDEEWYEEITGKLALEKTKNPQHKL